MKDVSNARENQIKRLLYQSWHRGCKETDCILGNFAKRYLETFSDEELSFYEAFIAENDWDIYAWLTGSQPFPEQHENCVTAMIRRLDYMDADV